MKLHGIKVPHKKNTADRPPVRLGVPKTVSIPMSMHIGKPAKPVVKKGDEVKVGQLIGEADGFISAPVHSSVSGTVLKVDDMTLSNGAKGKCVVINTDGEQTVYEGVKPPEVNDLESFAEAVTSAPSGVAAVCSMEIMVPTVVSVSSPSSSAASDDAAYSISATTAGVASTSKVPLPMELARFCSSTFIKTVFSVI